MSQVVTIANHATLYLGDCREILPTLGKVDAVMTDPPYGTNAYATDTPAVDVLLSILATQSRVAIFGYPELACEWAVCFGRAPDEWITWWPTNGALRSASRTAKVTKESEAIAIWGELVAAAKRPRTPEGASLSRTNGESIDLDSAIVGDVWREPSPGLGFNSHQRLHPNEKPEAVMIRLTEIMSLQGQTILDPFMGSGTTGVAAVKLGRKFIGIEIEEKYFEIACRRIEQATRQPDLFIEQPPAPVQEALAFTPQHGPDAT